MKKKNRKKDEDENVYYSINNSFPSKVRFRKKVHSQASEHVWFFLNYSQSVRAKKSIIKMERYYRAGTLTKVLSLV